MGFIAGKYDVTYGGNTVGQIGDGITTEHFVNKRLITGDNEGATPQDGVYRGHEFFMEFTLLEYDATASADVFTPYAAFGAQGVIGRLDVASGIAKQLVMTAIAGTTAANSPTTVTADLAILAEGFPVRMLFAPDLRDIPIRMRLYPTAVSREFFVAA